MLSLCAWAQDKSDESDLSLGIQGGVGYMTTTGSLNDDFGGCALFTAGLTADYKRLRFKADFDYGQPGFNNINMYNLKDEHGFDAQLNSHTNATRTQLGLQVGYKVWSNKRISVTPAAGVCYMRYSWKLDDVEWNKDDEGEWHFEVTDTHDTHLNKVSWTASVDVDIKLRDRTTTEPFFLNNRYSRLSTYLRITPWVAGGSFKELNPGVKGMYLGATVRVTGFMQSLGF